MYCWLNDATKTKNDFGRPRKHFGRGERWSMAMLRTPKFLPGKGKKKER